MKTSDCQFIIDVIDQMPQSEQKVDARNILLAEIERNEKFYEIRADKSPRLKREIKTAIRDHRARGKRAELCRNPELWQDSFFDDLKKCGVIAVAAERNGVSYGKIVNMRKSNKDFALRFDQAMKAFSDRVEYAAVTRAIDGVEVKKFYKDEPLIDPKTGEQYTERQYSDSLLGKLLDAKKRDEYGSQHKHHHEVSGEVRVAGMSPEEARADVLDRINRLVAN